METFAVNWRNKTKKTKFDGYLFLTQADFEGEREGGLRPSRELKLALSKRK